MLDFFYKFFFNANHQKRQAPVKSYRSEPTMPKKFRLAGDFNEGQSFGVYSHRVYKKQRVNRENNTDTNYYSKKSGADEVIAAALYRLFLGVDRAPVMKMVYQKTPEGNYKPVDVVAKEIPGFVTISDWYRDNKEHYDKNPAEHHEEWTKAGLASLLFVSLLLGERDLNGCNWGKNDKGQFVRIDLGQSLKYSDELTANDLKTLPEVKDHHPGQWPIKHYDQSDETSDYYNLLGISKLEEFQRDEWKYALKSMLVEEKLLNHIAIVYSDHGQNSQTIKDLIARLKKTKKLLLGMPEFREFTKSNPGIIDEIVQDFNEFNACFQKDEDMQIDIDAVINLHQGIVDECSKEQVEATKPEAKSPEKEFKQFKKAYFEAYNSVFWKNPASTMNAKLNSGEISSIEQVRKYAKANKSTRTYRILAENNMLNHK